MPYVQQSKGVGEYVDLISRECSSILDFTIDDFSHSDIQCIITDLIETELFQSYIE